MFCPNCGTHNSAGARFCKSCGTSLGAGSTDVASRKSTSKASPMRKKAIVPIVIGLVCVLVLVFATIWAAEATRQQS